MQHIQDVATLRQNPDFREIWNAGDHISVRKINILIWSKSLWHADLHKNESTSVNGRKCELKCVRPSA